MKKLILFFTLSLGLTFSSCDNNSCKDILCGDNASCEEGTCNCLPGYEKNSNGLCISTLTSRRNSFVGTWNVSEDCSVNSYTFISTIVKHPTEDDQLVISNFYDTYNSVYAVMTSETTFEIPLQLHNSNRVTITGEGIYSAGAVRLNYNIELVDGSGTDFCTAFYTK